MSVLNTNITRYKSLADIKGKNVDLWQWLSERSDTLIKEVERIRAISDTEARKEAKKRLPCITPSGTFSHRAETGLIEHSGLIQFDIDHLEDVSGLKSALSEIPFIAYCEQSTSGNGLYGFIPLAYPENHKRQFKALYKAFQDMGVVIDSKPQNVASLRFASYDPEPYVNHNAEPFPYLSELPEVSKAHLAEPEKILSCIEQIERNQIDITGGYETWFPIGTAFLQFGEQGKEWFHRISKYSPLYDPGELNQYWQTWVKSGASADIGTFFNACKDHGILYTNTSAPHGMNPWTKEVFDSRCYPRSWDEIKAPESGTDEYFEMIREEHNQLSQMTT